MDAPKLCLSEPPAKSFMTQRHFSKLDETSELVSATKSAALDIRIADGIAVLQITPRASQDSDQIKSMSGLKTSDKFLAVLLPQAQNTKIVTDVAAAIKGGNDEAFVTAGYDQHLADLVVSTLAPEDYSTIYSPGDVKQKLEYLRRKYPFIYPWNHSTEGRRLIVTRAVSPAEVETYDKLTDDDQIKFCLQKLGKQAVVGVVYTRPYRAWLRTTVAIVTGQKPNTDPRAFQQVVENFNNRLNGIDFSTPVGHTEKEALATFLMAQIPNMPVFLGKAMDAARKIRQAAPNAPLPRKQTAKALAVGVLGHGDAIKENEVTRAFEDQLGDAPGDRSLREAKTLLNTAEILINAAVYPSMETEFMLSLPAGADGFRDNFVKVIDPDAASKWDELDGAGQTAEMAKVYRLELRMAGDLLKRPELSNQHFESKESLAMEADQMIWQVLRSALSPFPPFVR